MIYKKMRNVLLIRVLGRSSGVLLIGAVVLFSGNLSLTGCGATGDKPDSKFSETGSGGGDESDPSWLRVFDDGGGVQEGAAAPSGHGEGASGVGGRWTIAMATFSSPQHRAAAEEIRQEIAQISGMTGFEIASRADRSILHYGHYDAPSSARIRADIEKIHLIRIGERQPFARAFPTVVESSDRGAMPQFNLVRLWDQFPRQPVIYSLQIAFYTFDESASERTARKTAEETAARLRAGGDPAFYYHGPTMSVVTVGVFFDRDVDAITGYGPDVLGLQERYRYNLGNGKEIVETQRLPSGKAIRNVQPSFLINVPRQ